jgi:hypothetical protein
MRKISDFHCHTIFGPVIHELMNMLKNARSVADRGTPVKSTQLLKKDIHHIVDGTAGRILGMGEIQQTYSLYLLQMV